VDHGAFGAAGGGIDRGSFFPEKIKFLPQIYARFARIGYLPWSSRRKEKEKRRELNNISQIMDSNKNITENT